MAKYESMFRIDGKPILPPLMNMEKRLEMQMYREKSIQLERKFVTEKQRKRVQFKPTVQRSPRGQLGVESVTSTESNSSLSSEEEEKPSSNDTSSAPADIIDDSTSKRHVSLVDCGTNTLDSLIERNRLDTKERMRKLGKSKTICFDNNTGTLMRILTDEEIAQASGKCEEGKDVYLCEVVENNNLPTAEQTKRLYHLTSLQESQSNQTIPFICVNPPTPLTGPSNICETLSATESIDSHDASGPQSPQATQNQAVELTEDSAGELGAHCIFTSQTLSSRNVARALQFGQKDNEVDFSPSKMHLSIEGGDNSTALQFGQKDNEVDFSPSKMHLSIEGGDNSTESGFGMRSPRRSATSPSLKSLSDTIKSCSLTSSPCPDDSSVQSLVRSSSFTLEGPSKVLIDHFRQKNSVKSSSKNRASNSSATAPRSRPNSRQISPPSPNAYRDTVESKAKRVQKKIDTKTGTRASSNVRSKPKSTFNPYTNSGTPVWNSALPPPLKIKRSPYDVKRAPSAGKSQGTQKGNKLQVEGKSTKSNDVKKSASSTTFTVRMPSSRASLPNTSISNVNTSSNAEETMDEIDKRHRKKLMELISQQQEEQRRLQHAFETQQKMLLDQLSNERRCNSFSSDNYSTTDLVPPGVLKSSNSNVIFNDTSVCATSFDRSSPSLSVTSSHMSPGRPGALSGFTTNTSTNATYELPHSILSKNNVNSSLQRPLQITGTSSPVYKNNAACNGNTGNEIGTNDENRQHKSPLKDTARLEELDGAATTINAYTRGFLVRRLFQTEQIQRIVQTIKDTLIFVLNLHMETMQNPEEAHTDSNIKLKARLLQQLISASRTLHLIFFQTSIKERMEIIARDRKRIKTKLLSMSIKRSPRIVS